MDEIPVDLVHKIFIMIPIKSLLQARCVSKSWCKIIDDPFFAHIKYDCGEVEQIALSQEISDFSSPVKTISLYAAAAGYDNEESMMIHATTVPMVKFQNFGDNGGYGYCKGLLYFAEHYTGRIVVSNPVRSQFTILPPVPVQMDYCWFSYWTAIGLGFDSSTKTFKMVCTNKKQESSQFTLVHTLGTTSWREVPSVPAYYCDQVLDCNSVFVHGFLHWMIDPSDSEIKNERARILAFDVSKETFKVVPHPELRFNEHSDTYFRILDIEGNLGMLDLSPRTKFDIWVMDYEKKSWNKEFTIDITIVGDIYVDSTRVVGLWKHDEIIFLFFKQDHWGVDSENYWSYSMRTCSIKECDVPVGRAFSLQRSLISIPGATKVSRLDCPGRDGDKGWHAGVPATPKPGVFKKLVVKFMEKIMCS
ncbi:F-box protein At2g23160-like [Apium graveolens]|uniref:F-box protein At2g23160-like n=1 Tax=Apium graveolens TaxID=4045 RepID=UPI003D7AAB06